MPATHSSNRSLRLGEIFDRSAPTAVAEPALPTFIDRQVRAAIGRQWKVAMDRVTLRWGELPHPARVTIDTEVRVVGDGSDGWFATVFDLVGEPGFAVRLQAGVREEDPIATRALEAGALLRDEDIERRDRIRWSPPVPSARPDVGWRVMRDVAAGDRLLPPVVAPPPLVRAGEPVRLRWQRGSVTVGLEGHAEHDAGIGESVTVKLQGRRGRMTGRVVGPGAARLDS